jgi:hypothetical protein
MRSLIVLFFRFFSIFHFHVLVIPASFFPAQMFGHSSLSLSLFLYLSFSGKFWLLLGTRKSWISRGFSTTLTRRREDDRGTIPSFKRTGAQFFHSRGQGHTSFIQEDRGTLLHSRGQGHTSFIQEDRGTLLSFKRTGALFFQSRGQGRTSFIQEDRGTLPAFRRTRAQ